MHLSSSFIDLMAYVSNLMKTLETKQPSYEEVMANIHQLFSESEQKMPATSATREEYNQARFAVCAWIDETILNSCWQHRHLWLNEELQRLHYNTSDAGDKFFERLESLGPYEREVREVYYLCLALGFAGRYCQPGDTYHLQQIAESNLKILLTNPSTVQSLEESGLVPEASACGNKASNTLRNRSFSCPANLVWLLAPVLLFWVLYLIYSFTLSGISDNFLKMVAN